MIRHSLFFGLVCTALSIASPESEAQGSVVTSNSPSTIEQVYVAHAVRQSRTRPTSFCDENRIGFGRALFEDRFILRSIETRPSDGRIVRTDVQTIGDMHVCFGLTVDSATLNFRAEGTLAEVPFIGNGQCFSVRANFPEKGVTVMRCFLDLRGLPGAYVGGHLTSNTILSRVAVGEASDPPGYIQPSIVTIRLWRRRQADL